MEKDLVDLSLDDEEEEILQAHGQIGSVVEDTKFCLVGCFLTASVIHFPTMRNTMTNLWHLVKGVQISDLGEKRFLFKFFHEIDMERVVNETHWTFNNHFLMMHCSFKAPLIFAYFWIQIHDVLQGFRSEAMARQLRHDDSFCSARMPLRVEVAMMGWDLSLRAQSKRVLTMNIIWLKEEEVREKGQFSMDHDLEESAIEEGKEKKWAKRESDVCTNEMNMGSLVVREEKRIGRNYLLSMIAKGQAN
ncbi:hypothetical protein Goshw_002199 [Gossypium schwendimanii]|uniref:DUF4283 domain-containing protein n=1 Tax=Gossypium schwendimanii TaxID=34291 RepID=A0A7J9LJN5_GOSSC|nr:hypothetical protein [Gossypium schwendimanii]